MSKNGIKKQRDIVEQASDQGEEEEVEDESQRQCFLCGEVPESIICLACNHSVDIPCAAKLILQEQELKDLDISKIRCLICKETTHLSEEVQNTLVEYLQSGEIEYGMNEGNEEEEGEGEEEAAGNEERDEEGMEEDEIEGEGEQEEEEKVQEDHLPSEGVEVVKKKASLINYTDQQEKSKGTRLKGPPR